MNKMAIIDMISSLKMMKQLITHVKEEKIETVIL